MTDAPQFTVSDIACALGRTRGAVYRELRGSEPTGTLEINGKAANAWDLPGLPEKLRRALWDVADKRGFQRPETLLKYGVDQWSPRIPLSRVAPHHVDKARKIKQAYAEVLRYLDHKPWYDLRSIGLADYESVMGNRITARHWERTLERILERDGGRFEFERLELYLDENISEVSEENTAPAFDADMIRRALDNVGNTLKPTPDESRHIWAMAFEAYESLISTGQKKIRAKRAIVDYLFAQEICLAKNRDTLDQQFRYKYQKWVDGGRLRKALNDGRKGNSGRRAAPALTKEEFDTLAIRTLQRRGRIQQAWRELWDEGALSAACLEFYSPSRVPEKIRQKCRAEHYRLVDHYHGPSNARNNGAKLVGTYDGEFSGKVVECDDCTQNIYFWREDDESKSGYRIVRGQLFAWSDRRSSYIHCFQLIPDPEYTSLDILRGVRRLHDTWGLPDTLWFEQGIWAKASVLKGSRDQVDGERQIYGLEQVGVKIHNVKSGSSAKQIEGVWNLLQNMTDGQRGDAGRNEREEGFEHIERWKREVETGKRHPSECFYSYEEWMTRIRDVIDCFNDTPQHGKKCNGSTPREVFVNCLDPNWSPIQLPHEHRYMISSNRRIVKVTKQGIPIQIGKRQYLYRNEATGRVIGEKVMVWFDVMDMDSVIFGDVDGNNLQYAERAIEVRAMTANSDDIARAQKQRHAHNRYARQRFIELKKVHPSELNRNLRSTWVAPEDQERAEEIGRLRTEAKEHKRKADKVSRAAREVGANYRLIPGREDQQGEALELLRRRGIKAANLTE